MWVWEFIKLNVKNEIKKDSYDMRNINIFVHFFLFFLGLKYNKIVYKSLKGLKGKNYEWKVRVWVYIM